MKNVASVIKDASTPGQKVLNLIDFFSHSYSVMHGEGKIEQHLHYAEAANMLFQAVANLRLDQEEMSLVLQAYQEGYRRGRQNLSDESIDYWDEVQSGEGPTLTPDYDFEVAKKMKQ